MYSKFHLYVKKGKGKRRTSISLESILADMLALKLGFDPKAKEAHSAVRAWLQEKQDEQNTSQAETWILKNAVIMEIAQPKLVDKYLSMWDQE